MHIRVPGKLRSRGLDDKAQAPSPRSQDAASKSGCGLKNSELEGEHAWGEQGESGYLPCCCHLEGLWLPFEG